MNAYIVGCAKNCGNYIEQVFKNIEKISSFFNKTRIVVCYAKSNDDTLDKLKYMIKLYPNLSIQIISNFKGEISNVRTERIAAGRNALLQYIRDTHNNSEIKWTHMVMLDMDNVCASPMNCQVFKEILFDTENWDAISFNAPNYYDIWALSYKPFTISCWNWGVYSKNVVYFMRSDIQTRLESLDTELFECDSAFNGLAIYKLDKFLNCSYNHISLPIDKINYDDMTYSLNFFRNLFNDINVNIHYTSYNEDCEHRAFHEEARLKNGARICITPKMLFPNMVV